MNTNQLLKCIRSDSLLNDCCAGVYPIDQLPEPKGYPECCVVNLDPASKPGSHWMAVYIDPEGFGEFFDSYGRRPEKKQILKYLKCNCLDWTYNDKMLQSVFASTCGQYCIYYLYYRVRGKPLKQIVNDFGQDLEVNDMKVTSWLNANFDVNTDVFEFEFVVNQVCHALSIN
jgi:hypothetical protein